MLTQLKLNKSNYVTQKKNITFHFPYIIILIFSMLNFYYPMCEQCKQCTDISAHYFIIPLTDISGIMKQCARTPSACDCLQNSILFICFIHLYIPLFICWFVLLYFASVSLFVFLQYKIQLNHYPRNNHHLMSWAPFHSALQSKNTVCASINHNRYFFLTSNFRSIHSHG